MAGWIKIHRDIFDHWVSQDPVKFKWWLVILSEVNYCDNKFMVGNSIHEIKTGSSAYSLRTWAVKLGCGVKSVVSFFDLLESDGMITRKTIGNGKQSSTLINITNYASFQATEETQSSTPKGTLKGTQGKREGHTTKEGKEGKERKKDNISDFTFDDFWEIYPNKVAKAKCLQKFNTLPETEKLKIKETLSKFVNHKPFAGYNHPNPETYLNQKRWEDELPTTKNQTQKSASLFSNQINLSEV